MKWPPLMRLLVVSTWCPAPPDNGSRLRAFHLLRHLAERHAMTLLSFGRADDAADLDALTRLCARVEIVPPRAPGSGAGLTREGLWSPVPRSLVQTRSDALARLIAEAVPRHDAAIAMQIQAAWHLADHAAALPSVFDEVEVGNAHDEYARARGSRRLRQGLTWWKFRRFVRAVVARFDRATVVSDVERDRVAAIGVAPARIDVVPNGVDAGPLRLPDTRRPRLIYPGPVTYAANLDAVRFFVESVLPEVRRRHPAIEFVVTGATTGRDVSDLARVAGVTFTGRVPDVEPLLRESLACVVPLRFGGGTRLKVLHAMACGVPVVSTDKGVEGLDVTPERDVLTGETPAALAAQIGRLVEDPALGRRLAVEAHALVARRYDWGAIAARLEGTVEAARQARR
ncbi:MAG: glycosyltransferase family 4 protein [Vicinamibacterales bacterium]